MKELNPSSATISLFTEVGMLIKSRLQRVLPMPFAQCQALWFVAEQERPNMQDVAKHFKITAPSATFLVDELVRGGYLSRRPNARDRRKVELILTPKGKREFQTIAHKRAKILGSIFQPLSTEDHTDLNRILTKVLAQK